MATYWNASAVALDVKGETLEMWWLISVLNHIDAELNPTTSVVGPELLLLLHQSILQPII